MSLYSLHRIVLVCIAILVASFFTASIASAQTTAGQNVARGKPIIRYGGNVNYGDSQNTWPKVNDGDLNTHWLVSTNPATDLIIDLQASYPIWSISYAAFWDSNFGSGAKIATSISADNVTWDKIDTREIFDSRTAVHSVTVPNKTARYVRIQWEGAVGSSWNGWAEFKEVMVFTKPTATGWLRPDGSTCAVPTTTTSAATSSISVHYSKASCFASATGYYVGGHFPSSTTTACSSTGTGKCYFLSNFGQTSWLSWRNPDGVCRNYDSTYPAYAGGARSDGAFRSIEECIWNAPAAATTAPTAAPTAVVTTAPTAGPTTIPTNTPVVTSAPNCALQPKGDADCNGAVQSEDYTIWTKFYLNQTYATKQPYHKGDFNNDSKTDLKDAEIWRACFTTNCTSSAVTPTGAVTTAPTVVPTIPPAATVIPAASPTLGPGCFYQQVQCVRAPCNPIVVCPTATPASARATFTPAPSADPLVALKTKFVTDEGQFMSSANVSQVNVKSNTSMVWNNGCRGCGGSMCTQALVSGRRVVLYSPANTGTGQCVFHIYHISGTNYSSSCSPPTNYRVVTSCTADPFPPPAGSNETM